MVNRKKIPRNLQSSYNGQKCHACLNNHKLKDQSTSTLMFRTSSKSVVCGIQHGSFQPSQINFFLLHFVVCGQTIFYYVAEKSVLNFQVHHSYSTCSAERSLSRFFFATLQQELPFFRHMLSIFICASPEVPPVSLSATSLFQGCLGFSYIFTRVASTG